MLSLCQNIYGPFKTSKVEGPSSTITFLGIHLDAITMEPSNTAERNDSLLQELRTYVICTPDIMYKMTIIVSNRKTFLFMQSVTGWQNFSAQTHT